MLPYGGVYESPSVTGINTTIDMTRASTQSSHRYTDVILTPISSFKIPRSLCTVLIGVISSLVRCNAFHHLSISRSRSIHAVLGNSSPKPTTRYHTRLLARCLLLIRYGRVIARPSQNNSTGRLYLSLDRVYASCDVFNSGQCPLHGPIVHR